MASYSRINWLIAFALIGWFFYLLAPVLTPFVAAAILAYIGNPLTGRLQRLRFSRTVAVVIVIRRTRARATDIGPSGVHQREGDT